MIKKEASGIPFEWEFQVLLQVKGANGEPDGTACEVCTSLDNTVVNTAKVTSAEVADGIWKHFAANIGDQIKNAVEDLLLESVLYGCEPVDRLSHAQKKTIINQIYQTSDHRKAKLERRFGKKNTKEDNRIEFRCKTVRAIARMGKDEPVTQQTVAEILGYGETGSFRKMMGRYGLNWKKLQAEGKEIRKNLHFFENMTIDNFLLWMLSRGPESKKTIQEACYEAGFQSKQVRGACRRLGVLFDADQWELALPKG